MKSSLLPDNILRRLDPKDRAPMGKAGLTAVEASAKQVAKSEKELQKQISNYLRLNGIWFAWSRMDKKTSNYCGQPDFIFAISYNSTGDPMPDISAYAVEVKFGDGQLSPEQIKVREQMISNGWDYHVVRSLQEVIDLLKL